MWKGLVLAGYDPESYNKILDNLKKLLNLIELTLSMSGFVVKHATVLRTVVMAIAFFFSIYLANLPDINPVFALLFFVITTAAYVGFLYTVLPKHGLRHWFVKRFGGEKEGYLAYEAVLGFLFFISGAAVGIVSVAFKDTIPLQIGNEIIRPVAAVLFVLGWGIKLWATKVTGVDIYYWKDMFLGRQIRPFVVEGPYRYFNNPMYGIGQLQAYATALWYQSLTGLFAALIYQLLVFSFYYFKEKKFITRVYLSESYQKAA